MIFNQTQVGKIFSTIGADIRLLFAGKLPQNWEADTDTILSALKVAQTWEASAGAITLAALLPKGVGNFALAFVQNVTNNSITTIEIAQGAEQATVAITDPAAKADAIFAYVVANINKLPANWQGKHWEDMAVTLLQGLLNVTENEAKAIVALQASKIPAPAAA